MIPLGFVTDALLYLLAVVLALSLLTASIRCVRTYQRRRRERVAAPVRGLLLELLCAEEDGQSELLDRLAQIDRRTWAALEPTVTAMLVKVSGRARAALVLLCERRGSPAEAVAELRSRSAARRGRAAQVLGQLRHRPAAPSLCRLLDDRDPEVRLAATRALGRTGDPMAVPYLLRSLHGPRTVPYKVVTAALASLGPAAQLRVAAGLQDPTPLVRAVAIEVLGVTRAIARTTEVVRALREDPATEVRVRAARALGRLGMPDGLEPLLAAIRTGQPGALRIVAAGALGSLGAGAATGPLTELLGDADPHVAGTAARALLRLGPVGEAALREAADGRSDAPAAAQARAVLGEAAVGGVRHDVLVEVAL
ncbi:HEAT repeat domain-containing protein [Streptomyces sp. TRM68367]|uniref:HEAT repeat domain-containing protein n=1 Tax=Streptomyces sp. TRM68367 TaxID=2758415 RepID=UPI00165C6A38|nr:HEAT repeat domain-containing protein [Streptomyces sp. TRM68367]MBC9724722.1 HEAT repeat domain-containing protein [Streptomyces sp. TRM68367]